MSTTTRSSSDIPDWLKPYYQNFMDRAEATSLTPYTPYGGQRVAGQTDDTLASQDLLRDTVDRGVPQIGTAINATRDAMGDAGDLTNNKYQFSQYNYTPAGTFNSAAAAQYMSPYMQNVVDAQKSHALEDFQMQDATRNAAAVRAGAFGGSGRYVQQGLAERDYLTRTNDIQTRGLQDAYTDAERMFGADRDARLAQQQAQAAELARVQSGQSSENLNRDKFGLDALQFRTDSAQQLADLGQLRYTDNLQNAQLLDASGKEQYAYDQTGLDTAYQDFLRQNDWDKNQVSWYSDMLHGLPVSGVSDTTSNTKEHTNPLQQLLGAGISAVGLYNAWKNR